MSDTKSGDDKTLSVNTKKTLTLKRPGVEQGTVRQSFSHARSKAVVVETKKRKFAKPAESEAPQVVLRPKVPARPAPRAAQRHARPSRPTPERGGMVLNELSEEELEARRRAHVGAKAREVVERARAAEEARRREPEEKQRRREQEESARRQAEE